MPSTRKILEHRAVLELCVGEVLSSEWQSANKVAARAGARSREVMRLLMRMASDGTLEQRQVSWRVGRCRTRCHFEYRLPFLDSCHVATLWQAFPAWLLPPLKPTPDSTRIRHIRGRHTDITEDKGPMNEIELNELPRGVRERYYDLKDSQFKDHPSVIAARQRLEQHQDKHAECVETATEIRLRIEAIQKKQRDARTQLAAIADSRPKLIAEALLAGDDLSADRQAKAKCVELEHVIEAVDLGLPIIQRTQNQAMEATRSAAISLSADEEHLRGVLDGLKLEEAKRLYCL